MAIRKSRALFFLLLLLFSVGLGLYYNYYKYLSSSEGYYDNSNVEFEVDTISGVPLKVVYDELNSTFVVYTGFLNYRPSSLTFNVLTFAELWLDEGEEPAYRNKGYIQGIQTDFALDDNFNRFECCLKSSCVAAKSIVNEFNTRHVCDFDRSRISIQPSEKISILFRHTSAMTVLKQRINVELTPHIYRGPDEENTFALTLSTLHETTSNDHKRTSADMLSQWIIYHQQFSIHRFIIYFRSIKDLIWIQQLAKSLQYKTHIVLVHWPGFNSTQVKLAAGYYDQYVMCTHMLITHVQKHKYATFGTDWDEFMSVGLLASRFGDLVSYFDYKNIKFVQMRSKRRYNKLNSGDDTPSKDPCGQLFKALRVAKYYTEKTNIMDMPKPLIRVQDVPCVDVHWTCVRSSSDFVDIHLSHLRPKNYLDEEKDGVPMFDTRQLHYIDQAVVSAAKHQNITAPAVYCQKALEAIESALILRSL